MARRLRHLVVAPEVRHEGFLRARLRTMRRRQDSLRAAAPKQWGSANSSVGRLHRRLVIAVDAADEAVQGLRNARIPCDRLDEAATELRSQAVLVTAHLVVASRLPLPKRQRALFPYRNQVDDIEWLSARIGTSAIEARGNGTIDAGLADITERLVSLEQSRSLLAGDQGEARKPLIGRKWQ